LFGIERAQNPNRFDVFCMGHTLEWLSVLMDADQLQEEWVVLAADRLADAVRASHELTFLNFDVVRNEEVTLALGQLAHATSGLRRWRDEVEGVGRNSRQDRVKPHVLTQFERR
jgi:hypothetical protein